jgi:hypothetical protein
LLEHSSSKFNRFYIDFRRRQARLRAKNDSKVVAVNQTTTPTSNRNPTNNSPNNNNNTLNTSDNNNILHNTSI